MGLDGRNDGVTGAANEGDCGAREPRLLDQVRGRLRVKHYSLRTEQAYVAWIRRFILANGKRHPRELGGAEVEAFLTALATRGRVAAGTQNQALAALLFLYREVLRVDLPWMESVVRAKRPRRLPVVLSQAEVRRLLAAIDERAWPIAALLYGTGIRLMECLRLRVQGVDFAGDQVVARGGEGGEGRLVPLPDGLRAVLLALIERVKVVDAADVAAGYGEVGLPAALERKYPNAGWELSWQYLFPSPKHAADPRT